MKRIFFWVVEGSIYFLLGCTPPEEEISCVSLFDCPEGMECSPEGFCVEGSGTPDASAGGNEQSLPEADLLGEGDNGVIEGGSNEAMSDDFSFEEESSPTEGDVADPDDEDVWGMDEDTASEDDGEMALDGDIVVPDDSPVLPEEDVALEKDIVLPEFDLEEVDDGSQLDEDIVADEISDVADDDVIPEIDSQPDLDIVEKVKTIGSDNYTNTVPWSPNYAYRYSAAIYPKAQISTTPITITRLAWSSSTSGTSSVTANIKILLKETSDTVIPSQIAYTTVKSGAVEVFSGTLTGTQGWNEKVLDVPFAYSGTKNLLVLTELTVGTPGSARYWYYSGTSSNTTHSWYGTSDPASGNGINNEGLPNLRITYY